MNSDIVNISDLTDVDIGRWRELAVASVEPNPFVEPDFVLPAMRAWRTDHVAILRVTDANRWLAAIPVCVVASWRGVPGRCLTAWRHPYCYLSNPLIAPGDVEGVVGSLLQRGCRDRGSFGLEWIATDGPFGEALKQYPRMIEIEQFDRAAMYRHGSDDGARLRSGRTTKKLRQKGRQLERDSGELRYLDHSGNPTIYQRFLEIEASGWRGPSGTGTAMACLPGHGEFFIDMCERFASQGRLRLRALESDGRVLAIGSDLIAGDVLYFFKQAFDEQYARYSPGTQLELANMQAFSSGEWRMFDACASSENETYNQLWPGRRTLRTTVASGRDAAGTLNHAKWRAAAAVKPVRRRLRERAAARRDAGNSGSADRNASGLSSDSASAS